MTPRQYQIDCLEGNRIAFAEFDRVLDVVPTGGGKTVIFSLEAQRREARGQRTLILAHREELIDQAIKKLHTATGIRAEKEKAEFSASLDSPVVVASIQTMLKRLDKWPKDHFGLIVCDEAHHSLSVSWQTVLKHFAAQVLGVTATPHRGDKKNLGQFYQTIGYETGLFDLVDQGYLSRITLKSIPLQINLNGVGSAAGDFKADDLGSALEPYLDQIAAAIKEQAEFRRILCFLPLIATSQKFVAACEKIGLSAAHVDGESPDRAEILQRFANWEFDVLSNAMLLTEGFDDPGIDCVCVLRPTRSQPLFAQMIGRGTRVMQGKRNLLILDFLWLHKDHAIVRPAHLIAKDEEEAEQITKMSQEQCAGLPADLAAQMPLDLQSLAGDAVAQREEALRKRLEAQRNKQAQMLSAEQFAMQHKSIKTAEYQETMPWESTPVTEKQLKWLTKAKIDPGTVRSKGHASRLLDLYFAHKPATLASQPQRQLLRRMGHSDWERATAGQFKEFMSQRTKKKQQEEFAI